MEGRDQRKERQRDGKNKEMGKKKWIEVKKVRKESNIISYYHNILYKILLSTYNI